MLSVLSLIMKCAVKANARKDNPAAGHELRVPQRRAHQVPMLTMEESESLVEHTTDHYKAAMWLLSSRVCGRRSCAVSGLRMSTWSAHVIHIRRTWSPVPGFDGGTWRYVEGPVKTDAGQRSIPIPGWLCDELAADLARRPNLQRTDPLILNKQGRAVSRDTFRAKVVRPALRAAGLPEDFRTYDIRHTHASLLIDEGANVLAVAQRLGHTDPGVTLRVYGSPV